MGNLLFWKCRMSIDFQVSHLIVLTCSTCEMLEPLVMLDAWLMSWYTDSWPFSYRTSFQLLEPSTGKAKPMRILVKPFYLQENEHRFNVAMLLYLRASQNQVGQHFTFVLTDIESKQRFGFCRLTSGGRICLCILRWVIIIKTWL